MTALHTVQSVVLTPDFLRAQAGQQGFVNNQYRNLAWLEKVFDAKKTWGRWGVKTSIVSVPAGEAAFKIAA